MMPWTLGSTSRPFSLARELWNGFIAPVLALDDAGLVVTCCDGRILTEHFSDIGLPNLADSEQTPF
jgi:hypothetical protein